MYRTLYLLGVGYLALCGVVVLRHRSGQVPVVVVSNPPVATDPASAWFTAIKPLCNAVEVELAQQARPAPSTLEGQGYSAACYALGGKLDAAHVVIDRLSPSDRYRAAGIVFNIAHPVADAGDDASAGPIMELVIGYWPNHYMALYHAGMAEYALGERDLARKNLKAFLSFYHANDGWTRNAQLTLAKLRAEAEQ